MSPFVQLRIPDGEVGERKGRNPHFGIEKVIEPNDGTGLDGGRLSREGKRTLVDGNLRLVIRIEDGEPAIPESISGAEHVEAAVRTPGHAADAAS